MQLRSQCHPAVLNAKRVAEVIALEFCCPSVEVLTIEQLNPISLVGFFVSRGTSK